MQGLETFEQHLRHYSRRADGARQVRGFYDLSQVPFKLGNILLFAQNIRVVQALAGVPSCRFEFVTDRGFLNRSLNEFELPGRIEWARKLACTYSGLDYVGERAGPVLSGDIVFPMPDSTWDHKSYLFTWIAEHYRGLRVRAPYSFFSTKAAEFIQTAGRPVVCLHPKYDLRERSNALLEIWVSITARLSGRFQPVVVATDKYPAGFRDEVMRAGGLLAQDMGFDIFDESYLIHHGAGFIGIASGPSNFAIFSDRPYLIIKHEEDAWSEKFNEVVGNRLPMALPGQYFYIGSENSKFVDEKVRQWT